MYINTECSGVQIWFEMHAFRHENIMSYYKFYVLLKKIMVLSWMFEICQSKTECKELQF